MLRPRQGEGDDGGCSPQGTAPGTLHPHLKWYLPSPSLRMMASLSASLMRLRSSTTSSSSEGKNSCAGREEGMQRCTTFSGAM